MADRSRLSAAGQFQRPNVSGPPKPDFGGFSRWVSAALLKRTLSGDRKIGVHRSRRCSPVTAPTAHRRLEPTQRRRWQFRSALTAEPGKLTLGERDPFERPPRRLQTRSESDGSLSSLRAGFATQSGRWWPQADRGKAGARIDLHEIRGPRLGRQAGITGRWQLASRRARRR